MIRTISTIERELETVERAFDQHLNTCEKCGLTLCDQGQGLQKRVDELEDELLTQPEVQAFDRQVMQEFIAEQMVRTGSAYRG